jgi:hypothetical protein
MHRRSPCGLTAPQVTWTENRFFDVIRSGQVGSDDPETALARAKQNLPARSNDNYAAQLMNTRRRKAQKATYCRQLQIQSLGGPCKDQRGRRPSRLRPRGASNPQSVECVAPAKRRSEIRGSGGAVHRARLAHGRPRQQSEFILLS